MITALLIANRGEIAVRIARTARRLGIETIAIATEDDDGALHTRSADRTVPVGSYLDPTAITDAAARSGARAVHPGYGFLAEDAGFARAVEAAGLLWVGPPPPSLGLAGDKLEARSRAARAGIPTLTSGDPDDVGYPLVVKAAGGGGGRGMRVVRSPGELDAAAGSARREAAASFGDERVYLERLLAEARHVEVQILADRHGQVVSLGERDCSIQRRHQKVVEETPAPRLGSDLREQLSIYATALARDLGYSNAGTVEFLVEGDRAYFLEINARIQVEHAVTEEVYGLDLIEWQLRIAVGERLDIAARPAGHAIEARLYAEHPVTFLPQAGTIRGLCLPSAIRVDTGVEAGDSVSLAYDPLIAKLVAHGEDRAAALQLLVDALLATRVEGLMTNRALLLWVLRHDVMRAGLQTTAFLTRYPPLGRSRPAPPAWQGSFRLNGGSQQGPAFPPSPPTVESARHRLDAVAGGSGDVTAPMPGTVLQVLVSEGERVEPKQRLLVLEAMKMETPVTAPRRGAVERVAVSEGEQVSRGQLLVALAST